MKILVCISKVPDTTSKITFTDNDTKFNEAGVNYIMNPTDEWYALVRGIELKEAGGGSVTAVCVGDSSNDQIIRKALAIGADNAVRIDVNPTDAYQVAANIAEYAKSEGFDVVLTGKETINYNSSVVGGMVAELMDLPYVSLATNMEMNGNTATITREIEGGKETVEVNTPFVVSANKGLAEQRIPNMRGIMMAKRKPLNVIPAFAGTEALTSVINYELPPARTSVKMIDPENMEELVRLLHEEAKVI